MQHGQALWAGVALPGPSAPWTPRSPPWQAWSLEEPRVPTRACPPGAAFCLGPERPAMPGQLAPRLLGHPLPCCAPCHVPPRQRVGQTVRHQPAFLPQPWAPARAVPGGGPWTPGSDARALLVTGQESSSWHAARPPPPVPAQLTTQNQPWGPGPAPARKQPAARRPGGGPLWGCRLLSPPVDPWERESQVGNSCENICLHVPQNHTRQSGRRESTRPLPVWGLTLLWDAQGELCVPRDLGWPSGLPQRAGTAAQMPLNMGKSW